jgi:hypothetical protein
VELSVAASLVILTDADSPDPGAPVWRGYLGPRRATGTVYECVKQLLSETWGGAHDAERIRILTGYAARQYMAEVWN